MRIDCAKCGKPTRINSRPNLERAENSVYWRNYAVCPHCGSTSTYEVIGRVVFEPENWQPDVAETPLSTELDQLERTL